MLAPSLALARHLDDPAPAGRIGPNAILQLVPVLDATLGRPARDRLLHLSGIDALPDGSGMIDETPVARLHQSLRRHYPGRAPALSRAAGQGTADYILAHRIPKPARTLLRALPASLAAPLLSRAIAGNAWTFAGSGRFRLASTRPPVFEIAANPLVRGESSFVPLCHWHAAVFERLFAALVHPAATSRESACCAMGAQACRFEVTWRA